MSYNSYAKSIRTLSGSDRVDAIQAAVDTIISPDCFVPVLVNDKFCVAFEPLPTAPTDSKIEGYFFREGSLVVPRHMYRLDNVKDANVVGNEMARCTAAGGQSIILPYISNVEVKKYADQHPQCLTLNHYCAGAQPAPRYGGARTGGGVCAKKLLSASGYVAELWKWSAVYTADGADPCKINENEKEQLIYHFLMERFELEESVRLVSLVMPDNNIVRIPVGINSRHIEEVHKKLTDGNQVDNVYAVENLIYLDGPDIFLGECDFKAI